MPPAYNSIVINYEATWSPHVRSDLDALYEENPLEAALIDEFFDLVESNELVRRALAEGNHRRYQPPRFDSDPIQNAIRVGLNISRVKIWTLDGQLLTHRLIFAIHHGPIRPRIRFLGLMPRQDDYDPNSDFGRRVREDYSNSGIGSLHY